jgi:hypothetical protein
MGWLSSYCHVLWIFVKFEACGLLTQFWFCLPFFYLRVSNEFLYYLQEVSLPVLKDSIMEALKVLIGNEFLTSSVNFEMQIFSTSILLVWCFYCLFYR